MRGNQCWPTLGWDPGPRPITVGSRGEDGAPASCVGALALGKVQIADTSNAARRACSAVASCAVLPL